MRFFPAVAAAVAIGCAVPAPGFAQAPATKTLTVELDAEKDYFAPDRVRILAVSRAAGQVAAGELDVTIRRRIAITVPADTGELIFRTGNGITARTRIRAPGGTAIIVRPLAKSSSLRDIGWALGRRHGVAVERLVVETRPD